MSLKTINTILLWGAILSLTNLISVKIFGFVLYEVDASKWSLGENLSISYVTGYFVYVLTSQLPKTKQDKERIVIVQSELEYKVNQINVRLTWFGINQNDDKEQFEGCLKNHTYGEIPGMKITGMETLLQIKKLTNEIFEIGLPILISTDNSSLIKEYKDAVYKSAFMNPNSKYIKHDISIIEKNRIEIGNSLYGHMQKLNELNNKLKSLI